MSRIVRIISVGVTLLLLCSVTLAEHRALTMAYYDVVNLYDTIPSPHYNDRDYTPKGRYRWNSDRYQAKIESVAAVIDSISLPLVVLFGVESEATLKDIAEVLSGDYCYLHRTLDYYDGLDFAILYYGDELFVEYAQSGNTWLYVAGEMASGTTFDLHLTRRGEKLLNIDSPMRGREADIVVVAGDLSTGDIQRLELYDPLTPLERRGYGDTQGKRGWYFDSRVGTNISSTAGLYVTKWLTTSSTKHLPIIVSINVKR